MTTLTHQFVQGSGFPDGEGCAFVVDGHGWTITDPICCRKSRKEHEAMTTPTPTPTPTPRTDALTKRMAGELDRPMLQQNHFIELCDHSRQLERDLAAAQENLQSADEDRLRMRAQTARLDAALIEKDISIAAREAELAAMKQGKALADGMANMIRGFILKTVERETLDESAAKYRKWEEDYCHSTPAKLDRAIAAEQRAEAAERELAAFKAENQKLRSALEIVHFKREPWQ